MHILGKGVVAKLAMQGANKTKSINKNLVINASGCSHPNLANTENIQRENAHIDNIINTFDKNTHVIHCSTPASIGNAETFDEDTPYSANATDYGMLKRKSELKLLNHFPRLTILRIFSLTSVYLRKQIVWDTKEKASNAKCVFNIDAHQKRSFIHETDFINYVSFIIQNRMEGVVNITNIENVNLRDFVRRAYEKSSMPEPQFKENNDTNNYASIISKKSRLFKLGQKPLFVGHNAPMDVFLKIWKNDNV